MDDSYQHDQHIQGTDFSEQKISREYEHCTFRNCLFAKAKLSNSKFIECTFEECDLSMAKLGNTLFRDVIFRQSKLVGLSFEDCNKLLFSADFEHCQLNFSSFYQMSLKRINFTHCSLEEVDFTEADLTGAVFWDCTLAGAIFDHTTLVKADFSTSTHYSIDPENNTIRDATFSLPAVTGLLDKYNIKIT